MKRKKRALTIFEILIAFSLTAVLMAVLFRQLHSKIFIFNELEYRRNEVFLSAHLRLRLNQIFSSASRFYTDDAGHLFFQFEHPLERDKNFYGTMQAHLFHEDHKLKLEFWPETQEELKRSELLLNDVNHLSFQFCDTKNLYEHHSKKEFETLLKEKAFVEKKSSWDAGNLSPPEILILQINKKKQFAFFFNSHSNPIIYIKRL